IFCFFFSSRRRHTRFSRDWSSDVCSSDLLIAIELVEIRFPWRNFWLDWLTASAILSVYLVAAAAISGANLSFVQLSIILPQLVRSEERRVGKECRRGRAGELEWTHKLIIR